MTQESTESKTIYIGLDGIIQPQQNANKIECIVCDITEDYTEAMVIASEAFIWDQEGVKLSILPPAEKSPIKCTGRIIWPSKGKAMLEVNNGYLMQIQITHIDQIDRERLDFAITKKKAFSNS